MTMLIVGLNSFTLTDPGARERARPYLRSFSVADPKLAICQARLKRSSSAPNHCNRSHTDQLPRRAVRKKEEKNMQKGTSTSTEDVRAVGRMSLIGLEQGVDGIFVRRNDDVVERVITDFPVRVNVPSSRTDKINRPESFKRQSYPNEGHRTSRESLPESCSNCGQPVDYPKDVEYKSSTESSQSSEYLTCKKCGHVRNYSSGGRSLPGTPYSNHKTLEPSPFGLLSQHNQSPTKLNGNVNYKPGQSHGEKAVTSAHSRAASSDSKKFLNGGLKMENGKFENLPSPDSAGRQYNDPHYESPSALAQRLFNLDGFSREEVTPELSKK